MNILVAKNGTQLGPFTEADVRARLSSGEFFPNDLGWHEGLPNWVPLAQLLPAAPPMPPMPQPSPSYMPAPAPSYAPAPAPSYFAPAPAPYAAPYPQNAMPGWGVPGPANYAGFWLRLLAAVIDCVLVSIIQYVILFAVAIVIGTRSAVNLANFGLSILILLYFVGMASSASQATVGKMVMGLKVTDENGNRISFGRSFGRELGKILSCLLLGVGFLMAGFTLRKQALHDLMAGCLVLRK